MLFRSHVFSSIIYNKINNLDLAFELHSSKSFKFFTFSQINISKNNTVSDYDKMEKEKGYSINTSVIPILWKDTKINFVDTPGFFDYVGEVNAAMRAVEAACIIIDGGAGVQVGTEQAWKLCEKYKKPRFIVLNDKGSFDYDGAVAALKNKFKNAVDRKSVV